MRGNRHWMDKEGKACRVCQGEEETREQVLTEEIEMGQRIRDMLENTGGGGEWMRELGRRKTRAGSDKKGEEEEERSLGNKVEEEEKIFLLLERCWFK